VAMTDDVGVSEVVVRAKGEISAVERGYAREKIGRLQGVAPGPVLYCTIDLALEPDPARERRAVAKAAFDVNGRIVRAHVAATTVFEAIDALEGRMREQLERLAHHQESKQLRHRDDTEREWRHGAVPTRRPSWFPRPADEREIVRRKTFGGGERTVDEAVIDMELLDHDFYLFTNSDTGVDNVVARAEQGDYELLEPTPSDAAARAMAPVRSSALRPGTMTPEDAVERLNLGDEPYVYFLDPDDGRGRVLYRRYDGHYGLIVPSQMAPMVR